MRHIVTVLFLISLITIQPAAAADLVDLSTISLANSQTLAEETLHLGKSTRRGVTAEAWLEPVPATLGSETPAREEGGHFRIKVEFRNASSGEALLDGQVAVRTYTPDAQQAETVRMTAGEEFWSAEVWLSEDAETMLKIGSKLSDGKKRIYRYFFNPVPQQPENIVPATGGVNGGAESN